MRGTHPVMTILLIDDDQTVRDLLARVLQTNGYDVVTAASAEEAESIVETQTSAVALLVCDVCLPGVSGPELARRLAAGHPGLAILLMSGDPSLDRLAHDAVAAAQFIGKPFTTKRFLETVRALLAP